MLHLATSVMSTPSLYYWPLFRCYWLCQFSTFPSGLGILCWSAYQLTRCGVWMSSWLMSVVASWLMSYFVFSWHWQPILTHPILWVALTSVSSIDSPLTSAITPHSFIPGLRLSFTANPSHHSRPFLLQNWLHGFPGLFSLSVFTF